MVGNHVVEDQTENVEIGIRGFNFNLFGAYRGGEGERERRRIVRVSLLFDIN